MIVSSAVTTADTTVGVVWANPEGATSRLSSSLGLQGIHNKFTTHFTPLVFPSHRSPSTFDFFYFFLITQYSQPRSTLGLLFSSCLVLDLVWTLFGVGDMDLSQYFRRARLRSAAALSSISAVCSLGWGVNCHMDPSALKSSSRETGPHLIRLRWIINN